MEAKSNTSNCKAVALWASGIRSAILIAAPAIREADDTKDLTALLEVFAESVGELLSMVQAYSGQSYITRMLTSSVFKKKFELAKTQVKDMMASVQLIMQAVQLKMSQSAATGPTLGLTKQDIEDAIRSATKHEQTSSAINVAVDAKLDAIMEQQVRRTVLTHCVLRLWYTVLTLYLAGMAHYIYPAA
jgi:hypothetical protein